jgi:hypothetical protein
MDNETATGGLSILSKRSILVNSYHAKLYQHTQNFNALFSLFN